MSNENFEELFSPARLKEMAIIDIKLATKQCKENGYPKDSLIALARLISDFKKDFPAAPELESLERLAEIIIEKLARLRETAPEKKPKIKDTDRVFISELFPPIIPKELPAEILYSTSVIESKNYYQDNTLLLYSPFEEELVHLCVCYASRTKRTLRIIDLKELSQTRSHELPGILSHIFRHAEEADGEVLAFVGVEAAAENEACAAVLWEYLYGLRSSLKGRSREDEKRATEILLLSTDLGLGIESKYSEYIKSEYTQDSVLESYLYNIITDYVPLVSREKTLSVLRGRFDISDEDDELIEQIRGSGIFLGWQGLSDVLESAVSKDELSERLARAKEARKKLLDDFIAISNLGLSRFSLLDWNYKAKKKTDTEKLPPIDPEDPILNPHYTLGGRLYDELISNSEISAKLERLMNVKDVPLLPKCAWAADFAIKGGDQLNLENIPSDKEEAFLITRWDFAFHAVARLLLVQTPKVVFDIPNNSTLGGQCCDGGATIRMNKRYLKKENVDDGVSVLLHELFHSVQHRAEVALATGEKDILGYYYYHLNISVYHIQQWKENFSRYRSPDPVYEDYYDQTVEAEARIFSYDAISQNGNIDHPRLDEDEDL